MSADYYYAPIAIVDSEKVPGTLDDGEVVAATLPDSHWKQLDESASVFILVCPAGESVPGDWTEKTPEEIEDDSPGVMLEIWGAHPVRPWELQ